jgi:hypothetical protein
MKKSPRITIFFMPYIGRDYAWRFNGKRTMWGRALYLGKEGFEVRVALPGNFDQICTFLYIIYMKTTTPKTASLWHVDEAHERIFRELAAGLGNSVPSDRVRMRRPSSLRKTSFRDKFL